jgi:hypothetical protein
MAAVLPHGALFRMGDEGAKLLEVDLLKALIGPQAKPDPNLLKT